MSVFGWFADDSAPRAVFLALSSGPWFATSWPVWTRGTVCRCLVGLLVNLHLALCFFLSSGPTCAASWPLWTRGSWTWSFTRPLCATTYAYGSDCIKLWSLRSCSPFCSSSSLSWRRCRFSWSFTTEFPQLQYIDKVVDVCCACPLCATHRQFGCPCETCRDVSWTADVGPCAQAQSWVHPRH